MPANGSASGRTTAARKSGVRVTLFEPAYTTFVVATKARDRFWDGDAVRVPYSDLTMQVKGEAWANGERGFKTGPKAASGETGRPMPESRATHAGAPLLDWWNTDDETALRNLTLAMCPGRVCRTCGQPSRRITETTQQDTGRTTNGAKPRDRAESFAGTTYETRTVANVETLGWSDCGHDNWRPGHIYDPFYRSDMTTRFIVADVFDGLASLEDDSVDLIVSSPPFLALRSYLPADHPDKAKEIGSEATPGEYLDVLLDVVEACARVLAPHGSLVFELGDTYSMGGIAARQAGGNAWSGHAVGARSGDEWGVDENISQRFNPGSGVAPFNGGPGWPLDKSKVMVPQLFAVALAYGFNPLTGRQTEPWRVRNTVAWVRPNPPVGRDGDKFRPATSFLTVACKARDRYWDGDAVREEPRGTPRGYGRGGIADHDDGDPGAPLLDWWEIPTHPYKGAHYATWPPALVVPLLKSMVPQRVCRVCGEPSRRITSTDDFVNHKQSGIGDSSVTARTATLGWSDCGHDDWRPGLVCDPFCGSGTTLAVASGHGYDSVGFDLDPRNADLARERVGMFLDVETVVSPCSG